MSIKIWLSSPHMGGNELKYVNEAFQTNWIAPLGPNVNAFEAAIQQYIGNTKEVVALSSGTAAIHLALVLLGVTKGDEVLCQSFTFSASANPILYQGATPVFVDSEAATWNICPVQLEKAITDRIKKGTKPKAIIAVHLYGMPYNVVEIQKISEKYQIPVIEDSAEALGSSVQQQLCGTFGAMGIFSFNGNKIITTSGGGALVCANNATKQQAVFLATQARDEAPHYQHSTLGYNYRLSNVLAGIGRGQLEVLNTRVAQRRANFKYYTKALAHTNLQFLQEPTGYFSNRWLSCITTPSLKVRETIRTQLLAVGIESRPLWKPMHLQPIFKQYPRYSNGISEKLFETGLCLPSGSNLTENDLESVVRVLKDF